MLGKIDYVLWYLFLVVVLLAAAYLSTRLPWERWRVKLPIVVLMILCAFLIVLTWHGDPKYQDVEKRVFISGKAGEQPIYDMYLMWPDQTRDELRDSNVYTSGRLVCSEGWIANRHLPFLLTRHESCSAPLFGPDAA